MLLSRFLQEKRKQRIEADKAEGIVQGKTEAEAKVLNEFAERIEAAQSNTKAEAKALSILVEQIGIAKDKGREEGFVEGRKKGFAEGKSKGATEVYVKAFDEASHISAEWSGGTPRDSKDDKSIAKHNVAITSP